MLLKCKYCGLERDTTNFGMSYHQNRCKENPNRILHSWVGKHHKRESIEKIGKHNRMGTKNPNSILDMSSRTTMKILKRLNLSCSNCGWNESTCDIHHIIPKKEGGKDTNDNLCVLCPNCHRLVHTKKLSSDKLLPISSYLGDEWKKLYYSYNGDVS